MMIKGRMIKGVTEKRVSDHQIFKKRKEIEIGERRQRRADCTEDVTGSYKRNGKKIKHEGEEVKEEEETGTY